MSLKLKNIIRIGHSYRECTIDCDECLTRASRSNTGTVLATNDAYGVRTQCFIGCDAGYSLSDLQNPTLPGIVICDSESNENASPIIAAQCTENTCLAFSLPDRVVGFAFNDIPACTY